jgi:hypothetical protein
MQYSTLDDEEKGRAMGLWERRWDKFVEYINGGGGVDTYLA